MSAGSLPLEQVGPVVSAGRPRATGSRWSLPLLLGLPVVASILLLVVPLLVLLRFSFLVNIPGRGLSDQTTLANYAVFETARLHEIIYHPSVETEGLKQITGSWQQRRGNEFVRGRSW